MGSLAVLSLSCCSRGRIWIRGGGSCSSLSLLYWCPWRWDCCHMSTTLPIWVASSSALPGQPCWPSLYAVFLNLFSCWFTRLLTFFRFIFPVTAIIALCSGIVFIPWESFDKWTRAKKRILALVAMGALVAMFVVSTYPSRSGPGNLFYSCHYAFTALYHTLLNWT